MSLQAEFKYDNGTMSYYNSGSALTYGAVVVVGGVVGVVKDSGGIAAGAYGPIRIAGIIDFVADSTVWAQGDSIYWNPTGNPVGGTAGSGAATTTASGGYLIGPAALPKLTGGATGSVNNTSAQRTATIAGSMTASDITGSDSSLGIFGNTPATVTSAGGAVAITGAIGGATSGNGGPVSLTGGAATAGNSTGGTITETGGAGQGSGAGGSITSKAGQGGDTGAGGAATYSGGDGGTTSGTGGAYLAQGGAGTAGNANGGAASLLGGNAHGSGTDGVVNIGTSNTSAITIGASGILTRNAGYFQANGNAAVTATTGGGTTGLIPAGASFVTVTSDNADKQISLPAASIGDVITILVGTTGCELISVTAADKVNEVTVGSTNELALTAEALYTCRYTKANYWIVTGITKLGAAQAALVPDAL